MIRNALALALLALAAAASAQTDSKTLSIQPSETRGFMRDVPTFGTRYSLTSALTTVSVFRHVFSPSGELLSTVNIQEGWRAEFDLSAVPAGDSIVSAFFETQLTESYGPGVPYTFVDSYSGTGKIAALAPTFTASKGFTNDLTIGVETRIDVTSLLRATAGRYAGFAVFDQRAFLVGSSTRTDTWAAPTLTVTYAPVPEPAPLAALSVGALALLRRRKR